MTGEEFLKKLETELALAKNSFDDARNGITMQEYECFTQPKIERQLKTCINKFDNIIDPIEKTKKPGFTAFCENFKDDVPCKSKQCSCHKNNLEYIQAHQKYEQAKSKYENCLFAMCKRKIEEYKQK